MQCRLVTTAVDTPEGKETVYAIVCGRRAPSKRCVVCQTTLNIKLCDAPLRGHLTGKTCSRPVCGTHAHHVEPDYDLCPSHHRVLAEEGVVLELL